MTAGAAREEGAATILVVAMAGVLVFVTVGLSAAGGLVSAQRRAQSAADLAALAAASAAGDGACRAAGDVATANGAALTACILEGPEVSVVVTVPGPDLPGRHVRVSAEARAGPG